MTPPIRIPAACLLSCLLLDSAPARTQTGSAAWTAPAERADRAGRARRSGAVRATNLGVPVDRGRPILVDGTTAASQHEEIPRLHGFDLVGMAVVDTGMVDSGLLGPQLFGGFVAAGVPESSDWNGDGDTSDAVVSIFEVTTGEIGRLTALPAHFPFNPRSQLFSFDDDVLVLETSEIAEGGIDRNGDGDATDVVLETFLLGDRNGLRSLDGSSLRTVPRSLRGNPLPATGCCPGGFQIVISLFRSNDRWLFVNVDEASIGAGVDLNGDGDTIDAVLHAYPTDGGPAIDLGVSALRLAVQGDDALAIVSELLQGEDHNGDGDTTDQVFFYWDSATETLVNTQIEALFLDDFGGHWVLVRAENVAQEDFNGDGDMIDRVPHLYDPDSGTLQNIGFVVRSQVGFQDKIVLSVDESANGGVDLNGDGDAFDSVLHLYDVQTGVATNLVTALYSTFPMRGGDRLVGLVVSETSQNADFNFDGDSDDLVLGVYDSVAGTFENSVLALRSPTTYSAGPKLFFTVSEASQGDTDLNGDGDALDTILYCHEAGTNDFTSLGYQVGDLFDGGISQDMFLFLVDEEAQGEDLDGDGLMTHEVAHVVDLRTP